MTKESYGYFLTEVSTLLEEEEFVIIQDNAPCHREFPFLSDLHRVLPLPRYSPFLNITENSISCLKSAVKRRLACPEVQRTFSDRERARMQGITLQKLRLNILKGIIEENVDVITRDKCLRWYGHSLTYMDRCREQIDIFV